MSGGPRLRPSSLRRRPADNPGRGERGRRRRVSNSDVSTAVKTAGSQTRRDETRRDETRRDETKPSDKAGNGRKSRTNGQWSGQSRRRRSSWNDATSASPVRRRDSWTGDGGDERTIGQGNRGIAGTVGEETAVWRDAGTGDTTGYGGTVGRQRQETSDAGADEPASRRARPAKCQPPMWRRLGDLSLRLPDGRCRAVGLVR